MASVIAYVDGFNLYHGLHQGYGRRYLWLDLQHCPRNRLPAGAGCRPAARRDRRATAPQVAAERAPEQVRPFVTAPLWLWRFIALSSRASA
jgi:hypothetical protein